MRKNLLFPVLLLVASFLRSGADAQTSASPAFVTVREGRFFLQDRPYFFIGANYWYGAVLYLHPDTGKGRQRLRRELDFLQRQGVKNLRILAAAEGSGMANGVWRVGPALQPEKSKLDTTVLRGLDFLLYEMGRRDMKAVLYMSNNWEWSGGFLQYLRWENRLPEQEFRQRMSWDAYRDHVSAFYSCDSCQLSYRRQVQYLLTRRNEFTGKLYRDDPAIMAWQLANEPRPMRPAAIPAYINWVNETAAWIKSVDSNHLVSVGSEGWMGSENLSVYKQIHIPAAVDYLTLHIWPKNWGWFSDTAVARSFDTVCQRTIRYLDDHITVAQQLQKPLVVEEFGLPRDGHRFHPGAPVTYRNRYYQLIFSYCSRSKSDQGYVAGCNFWGFSGFGKAGKDPDYRWQSGDDWLSDPPGEEQGLNSVFASDARTWKLISLYARILNKP